jgi:hypothetical protein
MKLRKPLTYDHPLLKEAEQAWSNEFESNEKLQALDDLALSFYADGFIDGYVQARLKQAGE